MTTYFIGSKRELKSRQLTIQFPARTIHVAKLNDVPVGRSGPAVIFIGAEAYDLYEYVSIRNQLRTNHPDGLLIRLL